jgi:hypothetical protein
MPDELDLNVWGWMHIIESLANFDITKFDQVTSTSAWVAFTHMSYLVDKNNYDAYKLRQLQRRS